MGFSGGGKAGAALTHGLGIPSVSLGKGTAAHLSHNCIPEYPPPLLGFGGT